VDNNRPHCSWKWLITVALVDLWFFVTSNNNCWRTWWTHRFACCRVISIPFNLLYRLDRCVVYIYTFNPSPSSSPALYNTSKYPSLRVCCRVVRMAFYSQFKYFIYFSPSSSYLASMGVWLAFGGLDSVVTRTRTVRRCYIRRPP
jgi:hypothetical protein